jgi:hypothetical protein
MTPETIELSKIAVRPPTRVNSAMSCKVKYGFEASRLLVHVKIVIASIKKIDDCIYVKGNIDKKTSKVLTALEDNVLGKVKENAVSWFKGKIAAETLDDHFTYATKLDGTIRFRFSAETTDCVISDEALISLIGKRVNMTLYASSMLVYKRSSYIEYVPLQASEEADQDLFILDSESDDSVSVDGEDSIDEILFEVKNDLEHKIQDKLTSLYAMIDSLNAVKETLHVTENLKQFEEINEQVQRLLQ